MADIEKVCYDLPTSLDTSVFGPEYWKAFHDLANRIPCGICQEKAKSFVVFWHDLKNKDLGKPIYDKENFDYWTFEISKQSKKNKFIVGTLVAIVIILVITILTRK